MNESAEVPAVCDPVSAVHTRTGYQGDDNDNGSHDLPVPDPCGVPITQDEEVPPDVLDAVSHQLLLVAEDGATDEMFNSVIGHVWKDCILLFEVKWSTDETSLVSFLQLRQDYPRSEIARYILANKDGTGGARYSGGRYTRWARQYQRLYTKVIRWLVHCFDGVLNSATERQSFLLCMTPHMLMSYVVYRLCKDLVTRTTLVPGT